MPDFRIPRRSGAHRIAAIALYRALLSQCRAITLSERQQDEAQNIIRNRFKQAQHLHSTRRLKIAFEAGYEAIDHLDSAVAGDAGSKTYLASLLERAPGRVKQPPKIRRPLREVKRSEKESQDFKKQDRPRISLFDRPLPLDKLSGKRHVPVLVTANRFPMLRLKKPQPQSLSLYIHKRILQRQKWHNTRMKLESEGPLAEYEDQWDEITSTYSVESNGISEAMAGNSGNTEPRWASTVEDALSEVQGKIIREKEKNRAMAEKMQGVIDREQKLFEEEEKQKIEEQNAGNARLIRSTQDNLPATKVE